MNSTSNNIDYKNLPTKYQHFYNDLALHISPKRLFIDPAHMLAFGTDASFYRLIPKVVIKAQSLTEISHIKTIALVYKSPNF